MADNTFTPTRSWLFTPATRPDRFAKASAVSADVIILDLEDAVAPNDKDRARITALDYLRSGKTDGIGTRSCLATVATAALRLIRACPSFW